MHLIVDGIIYETQPQGGIPRMFNEILPRLCDLDPEIDVTLLSSAVEDKWLVHHPRIQHRSFPPVHRLVRPTRLWGSAGLAVRSYFQGTADSRAPGSIWHSTYYTLPARRIGPVVTTLYDMVLERLPHLFVGSWYDRLRGDKRRALRASDTIICISISAREDLLSLYPIVPEKIQVVPNGYSPVFRLLHDIDPSPPVPAPKPFLLYIGSRYPYKNFTNLLRAYSRWSRRDEADLVVVGSSWTRNERVLLEQLRINQSVHLLSSADDNRLCVLYNQAAAFVYPSLYEGFGIPLLEAMACGCPVVASRIPSTIEVAGEVPIYFEPTNGEEMVVAMDRALAEGRNSERVRCGLEEVKRYSWDETARQMLEIYRELL